MQVVVVVVEPMSIPLGQMVEAVVMEGRVLEGRVLQQLMVADITLHRGTGVLVAVVVVKPPDRMADMVAKES